MHGTIPQATPQCPPKPISHYIVVPVSNKDTLGHTVYMLMPKLLGPIPCTAHKVATVLGAEGWMGCND